MTGGSTGSAPVSHTGSPGSSPAQLLQLFNHSTPRLSLMDSRSQNIISKPKTEIVWIISAQRMRFGLNSQGWHYQKFKIGLSKASNIFQLKHAGKLKTLRVSVIKDVTHVNVILIRPIHVNVDNTDILLRVIMDFSIPQAHTTTGLH